MPICKDASKTLLQKQITRQTSIGARPEAQTALGKQKIRSARRGYMSHCQNSVKNYFLAQNFTEIDNRLLSYGRNDF